MTFQMVLVLVMVAVAAIYLGWTLLKSWRKIGGGSCCGKSEMSPDKGVTFIPSERVELRRDRRTDNGQVG